LKVSLIYLPHPYLKQPDAQAPLGLMYLAGSIMNDHDIKILNYSSFSIEEAINDLDYADVYGITATCLELPQANKFSKKIKEKFIESKIILGGPGTIAGEFVDFNYIDSICRGEGEEEIINILDDVSNDKLQKQYIGSPVSIENSVPVREFLNFQGGNIFAYNNNYHQGQSTIILTSRGCPYNCAYCSSPNLRYGKLRYRSPQSVYNEIKSVIDKFNIKQFRFSDDMFTANKKRVFDICDLIGPLDISWRISTRVKPIDYELYKAMYEAGCKEVSFGIESFDNNVLKVLKKGTTVKDNVLALETSTKVGMTTRVLFMVRTPGQTEHTVPLNINWLERVPYDIICCTTFVPLPGSDIWLSPENYGIEIIDKNMENYNFYFFDTNGEVELKNIIDFKDRNINDVNKETEYFKEYLKSTGKLNKG